MGQGTKAQERESLVVEALLGETENLSSGFEAIDSLGGSGHLGKRVPLRNRNGVKQTRARGEKSKGGKEQRCLMQYSWWGETRKVEGLFAEKTTTRTKKNQGLMERNKADHTRKE